jgi:hypothetical protein
MVRNLLAVAVAVAAAAAVIKVITVSSNVSGLLAYYKPDQSIHHYTSLVLSSFRSRVTQSV